MCGREGIRRQKLRIFFIAAMLGVLFGRNSIKCWLTKKESASIIFFFFFLVVSFSLISNLAELYLALVHGLSSSFVPSYSCPPSSPLRDAAQTGFKAPSSSHPARDKTGRGTAYLAFKKQRLSLPLKQKTIDHQ